MNLIGHVLNKQSVVHTPGVEGGLYDYVIARDGIYIHSKREHLEVNFPVIKCEINGLLPSWPVFKFDLPKVPAAHVAYILRHSAAAAEKSLEILFYPHHSALNPFDDGWLVDIPPQAQTSASCRPLDDGEGSAYQKAIIEIHSHHRMAAKFSKDADDLDETGFRLYGVVGRIPSAPEIRMRVGVFGHFWEIPASWVLELPEDLVDCVAESPSHSCAQALERSIAEVSHG